MRGMLPQLLLIDDLLLVQCISPWIVVRL